jgi:hypothetical protein
MSHDQSTSSPLTQTAEISPIENAHTPRAQDSDTITTTAPSVTVVPELLTESSTNQQIVEATNDSLLAQDSPVPATSHDEVGASQHDSNSNGLDMESATRDEKSGTQASGVGKVTQRRGLFKYISALLKNVGLEATRSLAQWRIQKEEPKAVLEKNRCMALVRLAVHILPLLGCILLFYYNLKIVLLPASSAYTILQFVAKLHEVLMQASIASILISHLRYEATSPNPIPFGSIFAGVRLTIISYLWSLEYFGLMSAQRLKLGTKLRMVLHIMFSLLLAVGVGPSSAILMVPRPASQLEFQCEVSTTLPVSELFPLALNSSTPGAA